MRLSKHNHNYSQYSNKKRNNNDREAPMNAAKVDNKPVEKPIVNKPEVVQPKPQLVQETVETVTLPETVEGFVVNCAKLNVRENASIRSSVVCVLDAMSDIRVDVNRTTDKWVYVYTATGLEGYCMREYIDAHL